MFLKNNLIHLSLKFHHKKHVCFWEVTVSSTFESSFISPSGLLCDIWRNSFNTFLWYYLWKDVTDTSKSIIPFAWDGLKQSFYLMPHASLFQILFFFFLLNFIFFKIKNLTKPEFIFKISKANPIVTPLPGKVCQAILTTLEHLNIQMRSCVKIRKSVVQAKICDITQRLNF